MGSTATPSGVAPVAKGEPGTAIKVPVPVLTENTERVLAPALATKSSLWALSNARNSAPVPDVKGEPGTGKSLPDASTAKAETVPVPEFVTKANAWVCPLRIVPHPARSKAINAQAEIKLKINRCVGVCGLRPSSFKTFEPQTHTGRRNIDGNSWQL